MEALSKIVKAAAEAAAGDEKNIAAAGSAGFATVLPQSDRASASE